MPDRLWFFNPGCPEVSCCDSESVTCETIPATLYLTDANGTHTMTREILFGTYRWYCCYTLSSDDCRDEVFDGNCTHVTCTIAVYYSLQCDVVSGVHRMTLIGNYWVASEPCTGGGALLGHHANTCVGDKANSTNAHPVLLPIHDDPPSPLTMTCEWEDTYTEVATGLTIDSPITGTVVVTE